MTWVVLLGGPWSRVALNLDTDPLPRRLEIRGSLYAQIEDPDTGDFLGGYSWIGTDGGPPPAMPTGDDPRAGEPLVRREDTWADVFRRIFGQRR